MQIRLSSVTNLPKKGNTLHMSVYIHIHRCVPLDIHPREHSMVYSLMLIIHLQELFIVFDHCLHVSMSKSKRLHVWNVKVQVQKSDKDHNQIEGQFICILHRFGEGCRDVGKSRWDEWSSDYRDHRWWREHFAFHCWCSTKG